MYKIGVGEKQEQVSTTYVVYSWSEDEVSQENTIESISSYTADSTTLDRNVFIKHNIRSNMIEKSEACYVLNETLYCLKPGVENYEENKTTLLTSFGEERCSMESKYVSCYMSEVWISAGLFKSTGYVYSQDIDSTCSIVSSGSSVCTIDW